MSEQIHFITGKLAEKALRETLETLSEQVGFRYTVQVLPITVAALMTTNWLKNKISIPAGTDRMILPGYCSGELSVLQSDSELPIERGPKDLGQLPRYFGKPIDRQGYGKHDIQIIAEINHAARYSIQEILEQARRLKEAGADLIDVGCDPGGSFWPDVADYVKALTDEGYRTSIDSLNPDEIGPAVNAGAELVLSVNQSNLEAAADWGVEVIVIPDDIHDIESMEESIEFLAEHNVPMRLDPILEPIGLGFAASLDRYSTARKRWPDAEMMMGIGNLTELTDVDSAGVNVLLLGICQELGIRSVLTTQVAKWTLTSVKECDLGRRLVYHAVQKSVPPKRLEPNLIMLRDAEIAEFNPNLPTELAENIRDHDLRIFADGSKVHLVGNSIHLSAADPFEIFDELDKLDIPNLDPSHAFYLGYEMCKALTANTLGKQYSQDEALNWGLATTQEIDRHRLKKRNRSRSKTPKSDS